MKKTAALLSLLTLILFLFGCNGKTVNFEPTGNGSFDPTNKKYKIAIVCTPSKEGDAYNGAPDSALWIKSLEITY